MLPVLFVSHGPPNLLLENDSVVSEWHELARRLPRPKSILLVSAHWETKGIWLGGNRQRATIHDFYGFPEALYEYRYPAPSATELADQLARKLHVMTDHDRGLDHGAWVPLLAMYPEADVPVVQMSVSPHSGANAHLDLGRKLAFLRQQGVLIICSGVVVHNLGQLDWSSYLAQPDDWALTFMRSVNQRVMTSDWQALLDPHRLPHGKLAVPTIEHYLPLLVAGGAAQGDTVELLCDEWRYGNLGMHAYLFGA
jgi:4,5-DOPA dioxygenase extradiol